MSGCGVLLDPPRCEIPQYGDWRAHIPVGLLRFPMQRLAGPDEFAEAAEFLKIPVEAVATRWERDRVHNWSYPPEPEPGEDATIIPGLLSEWVIDQVAIIGEEAGLRRMSSTRWGARRRGVTASFGTAIHGGLRDFDRCWERRAMIRPYGGVNLRRGELRFLRDLDMLLDAPISKFVMWDGGRRPAITALGCTLTGNAAYTALLRLLRNAAAAAVWGADLERLQAVHQAQLDTGAFLNDLTARRPA